MGGDAHVAWFAWRKLNEHSNIAGEQKSVGLLANNMPMQVWWNGFSWNTLQTRCDGFLGGRWHLCDLFCFWHPLRHTNLLLIAQRVHGRLRSRSVKKLSMCRYSVYLFQNSCACIYCSTDFNSSFMFWYCVWLWSYERCPIIVLAL